MIEILALAVSGTVTAITLGALWFADREARRDAAPDVADARAIELAREDLAVERKRVSTLNGQIAAEKKRAEEITARLAAANAALLREPAERRRQAAVRDASFAERRRILERNRATWETSRQVNSDNKEARSLAWKNIVTIDEELTALAKEEASG